MTAVTPSPDRLALTYREAAHLLGVSERTCWSLVAQGELQAVRIGRCVRIPRAELERYLAADLINPAWDMSDL